jgi:hypothetical protein
MTRICLYLSVLFLWLADHRKADREALWDSAQNFMERLCGKDSERLKVHAYGYHVLHQRATERAEDLEIEHASA